MSEEIEKYDYSEKVEQEDSVNVAANEEDIPENPREEIFPGGPTFDMIEGWKSRFSGEIYLSEFGEKIFIWRPLRRTEFKKLHRGETSDKDEYFIQESICRTCTLWPENLSNTEMSFGPAGIPTTLSDLILQQSGFRRPLTRKL